MIQLYLTFGYGRAIRPTSLLFAQKKTADEIKAWDASWLATEAIVESKVKSGYAALRKAFAAENDGPTVAKKFLDELAPIVKVGDWVSKSGKSAALMPFARDWQGQSGEAAAGYYRELIKTAGFQGILQNYIFQQVAAAHDHEFPVFMVDEIGYKLSKRREKARPNQLALFRGRQSKRVVTNLHLAEEPCDLLLGEEGAGTVLHHLQKSIKWSA